MPHSNSWNCALFWSMFIRKLTFLTALSFLECINMNLCLHNSKKNTWIGGWICPNTFEMVTWFFFDQLCTYVSPIRYFVGWLVFGYLEDKNLVDSTKALMASLKPSQADRFQYHWLVREFCHVKKRIFFISWLQSSKSLYLCTLITHRPWWYF